MRSVGRHTGERAAEVKKVDTGFPRRKILLLALGVTGTLVAWGVLVYAAIDFGQEARSGEPTAWVMLTLTTLGAAACLFVTCSSVRGFCRCSRRAADHSTSDSCSTFDSSDSSAAGSAAGRAPGDAPLARFLPVVRLAAPELSSARRSVR